MPGGGVHKRDFVMRLLNLASLRPMDDINNNDTIQADEDVLTFTATDEEIEAAAGIERGADTIYDPICKGTLWICF
jgi:hypothetical protein